MMDNSLLHKCVSPSSSRPLICSSFSLMISIVSLELSLVESSSLKPFISWSKDKCRAFDTHYLDMTKNDFVALGDLWYINVFDQR